MNRYLVVDLKDNIIYNTSDLNNITDENAFDRFGSSISCIGKEDLIEELENIIKEMKENEY